MLLLIMRNPLSFFMTNAPSALPFMSIIALLTIAGSICATSLGILQQNLPGAQAESSWYPSSYGTPFQERIAEADRIAALEASLFWKNTTPSLKKKNNLGQIHHMYSHINLLSEKGLVFYLYLQKFHMDFSLSRVIFAMANFDKRKFFLRHPVDLHSPLPRTRWFSNWTYILCPRHVAQLAQVAQVASHHRQEIGCHELAAGEEIQELGRAWSGSRKILVQFNTRFWRLVK